MKTICYKIILFAIFIFTINGTVLAQDTESPTASCISEIDISLNQYGVAYVNASTFDDGSTDNSGCISSFKVKRADEPDSDFSSNITFDCGDIGEEVMVVLRVYDCSQNFSDCMSVVHTLDKTGPTIECPPDITVQCDDLSEIYGGEEATAYDNCSSVVVTHFDSGDPFACNSAGIERTWIATDENGNTSECIQTIIIESDQNISVTFFDPNPPTVFSCGGYSFDEPDIHNTLCSVVGVDYDEDIFTVVEEGCFKVVRTWKIMNWCIYDMNNPNNDPGGEYIGGYDYYLGDDGYMEYTQVLQFVDDISPNINQISDTLICNNSDDCGSVFVNFPPEYSDDCTPYDELILSYSLYNIIDGELIPLASDVEGSFYGLFENGNYRVTYLVNDRCGNTSTMSFDFEIRDCKEPTAYCLDGINSVLMPTSGMVSFIASDFDLGSYDNCGDVSISFSENINDTILVITCDDLIDTNLVDIELFVTDEVGNFTTCNVHALISDNDNICNPVSQVSGQIIISGEVPNGSFIEIINSENELIYSTPISENGEFNAVFPEIEGEIFLKPIINDDVIDGLDVTDILVIIHHLLENNIIDNPDVLEAADFNLSGDITLLDIIQLRALLLGNIQLNSQDMWRFKSLDENYFDMIPVDLDSSGSILLYGIKRGDVNH